MQRYVYPDLTLLERPGGKKAILGSHVLRHPIILTREDRGIKLEMHNGQGILPSSAKFFHERDHIPADSGLEVVCRAEADTFFNCWRSAIETTQEFERRVVAYQVTEPFGGRVGVVFYGPRAASVE